MWQIPPHEWELPTKYSPSHCRSAVCHDTVNNQQVYSDLCAIREHQVLKITILLFPVLRSLHPTMALEISFSCTIPASRPSRLRYARRRGGCTFRGSRPDRSSFVQQRCTCSVMTGNNDRCGDLCSYGVPYTSRQA